MSNFCRVCNNVPNSKYRSKHVCQNHKGSSSSVEKVGAYRIFERSEVARNLQYTQYYGDGDSKAFDAVKDIYDGNTVTKLECIGHMQKRVGSRLRKLEKSRKGLGGKEKLTDNFIDKLQNYYGIAIRSNLNNLENMQSAVIAAFYHSCSSSKHSMHRQCPEGANSWCKYQQAKAQRKTYHEKAIGLPQNIIKPVYLELSDQSLIKKVSTWNDTKYQ
ncbi:hypothetical protein AVEN_127907-1 [Araneus ventricosus]|uniref:Mutator-like transposase domain-containing protein n=1 Tax=Araneus ventricosus TaxID=182803 RepID=A0A4Y1ZZC9_ARAVE|nr:hypothetical protein AVEN_127907-1 [Araneus ventricosus]